MSYSFFPLLFSSFSLSLSRGACLPIRVVRSRYLADQVGVALTSDGHPPFGSSRCYVSSGPADLGPGIAYYWAQQEPATELVSVVTRRGVSRRLGRRTLCFLGIIDRLLFGDAQTVGTDDLWCQLSNSLEGSLGVGLFTVSCPPPPSSLECYPRDAMSLNLSVRTCGRATIVSEDKTRVSRGFRRG